MPRHGVELGWGGLGWVGVRSGLGGEWVLGWEVSQGGEGSGRGHVQWVDSRVTPVLAVTVKHDSLRPVRRHKGEDRQELTHRLSGRRMGRQVEVGFMRRWGRWGRWGR